MSTATTIQFDRVLFLIDTEEQAFHALPYVAALQQQFGSRATIAHVQPLLAAVEKQEHPGEGRLELEKVAECLNPLITRTVTVEGELQSSIDQLVGVDRANIVVVASSGTRGVERLLLGSRAEEIFRSAAVPVLTVGPEAAPRKGERIRYKRLLYATDFSNHSCAALPYLESLLAQEDDAAVELLHVVHGDVQSPFERQRLRTRLGMALRAMIAPEFERQISDVVVEFGSPASVISEFANLWPADMIILGVRYGGAFTRAVTHDLWTVAHAVIAKAGCPVLTVRGSS